MPVAGDVPPAISEHPAHPGHNLKPVANDGGFFMCAGCKEHGAGSRYRCEQERCNFELHTCCAAAPDTMTHPLLGDRVFVFLLEAPAASTTGTKATATPTVCVACCEDVRGFVYHCFDDGLDLHPCCANLPEHALRDERSVVAPQQQQAPCPRDMTGGDNNRGRETSRRPAAARHRRWTGWLQVGRRDQPREHTVRQDGHVVQLRHEASASRSSDKSDQGNNARERRPPAARHRR